MVGSLVQSRVVQYIFSSTQPQHVITARDKHVTEFSRSYLSCITSVVGRMYHCSRSVAVAVD